MSLAISFAIAQGTAYASDLKISKCYAVQETLTQASLFPIDVKVVDEADIEYLSGIYFQASQARILEQNKVSDTAKNIQPVEKTVPVLQQEQVKPVEEPAVVLKNDDLPPPAEPPTPTATRVKHELLPKAYSFFELADEPFRSNRIHVDPNTKLISFRVEEGTLKENIIALIEETRSTNPDKVLWDIEEHLEISDYSIEAKNMIALMQKLIEYHWKDERKTEKVSFGVFTNGVVSFFYEPETNQRGKND